MLIGIVGSEQAKFTPETEAHARRIILDLLLRDDCTGVVSGGCHLGGVDIFAQEEANAINQAAAMFYGDEEDWLRILIHTPRQRSWAAGYKPRNLLIAQDADEIHCITVAKLPDEYSGMKFPLCYHCSSSMAGVYVPHIKSGGCWTMHKARALGKPGYLHVV